MNKSLEFSLLPGEKGESKPNIRLLFFSSVLVSTTEVIAGQNNELKDLQML